MERSINDGLDYSGDAAAGSFFSSDFKKNDDLKQMLDSNRDNLKLEAMKRIIAMVAKGRDASDLFPAVVKNVVSKNAEVKKLVYVYLMRYAEEQQDLALLSISTFQRALKDPNQLIRASALRVLSSIRVTVIVPIVMLAIRDASADMSAYVRKTAAHAIPKLYSLDPEQKDELVQILDKLLADKTTLVMGSAVMAFEEICPDRIDLIHKNYRKLCSLMVDIDEWGQIVVLNMLTRYARTQFVDPNEGDVTVDGEDKPFYEDDDDDDKDDASNPESKTPVQMDADHRLLLKTSRPLLQSRNAAVVMAVAQLYHHVAPKSEVPVVVKALIRLLRSHVEVQAVVLTCIAAMSTNRKSLFEPYMKSFFVRSSDPTQIKLLKLEILTNIANEGNIPPILQEFQTYISSQDKKFVAATIEAIGRCASNIKEVAETCLNGLVSLLSHPDPAVVGGAVVVAKTLLQTQRSGNKKVISKLAKMVDRVTVGPARAAILWLLGEHCERLPKLPPDVLRKMAKSFPDEEDIVKLQILNLAAKLHLTNPTQTTLLCQYVLNLAKYDTSYDIRDRARFLRQLLFPDNPESMKLPKLAKRILLSSKPAPILQSKFKDRDHFQLGSLSHFINSRASGYQDLPGFPEVAPDPAVRDVEPPPTYETSNSAVTVQSSKKSKKEFYSDGSDNGSGSGSGSGSESGSGTEDSESDSGSASDSVNDSSSCDTEASSDNSTHETSKSRKALAKNKLKVVRNTEAQNKDYYEQYSDEDDKPNFEAESSGSSSFGSSVSSSGSGTDSGSSSDEEKPVKKTVIKKKVPTAPVSKSSKLAKPEPKSKGKKSNVDELLLDFDSFDDPGTVNQNVNNSQTSFLPITEGFLSPSTPTAASNSLSALGLGTLETASARYIPTKTVELVNKLSSGGLQVTSRFTRSPHLLSTTAVSIELSFYNTSKETFRQIRVGEKTLPQGMSVCEFSPIDTLLPGKTIGVTLGVDFNDTTQGAKMEILWGTEVEPNKRQSVTIKAPIGELVQPVTMSEALFTTELGKLRGMNEHEGKTLVNGATLGNSLTSLVQKVYEIVNLVQVPSTQDDLVRFAGRTISAKTLVLFTLHLPPGLSFPPSDDNVSLRFVVNCEKIVVGSMLLQELKEALK